jgi:hypothetical protein
MDSPNGHTARDKLATTPLPTKREHWAAYKAVKEAAEREKEEEDAETARQARLKVIEKALHDVRFLALATWKSSAERLEEIEAILEKLKPKPKEK